MNTNSQQHETWHSKEDEEGYDPKEDPQRKKKQMNAADDKRESIRNKEVGGDNPKPPQAFDINSKVDSMMEQVIDTLNKGKGKGNLPTKHN